MINHDTCLEQDNLYCSTSSVLEQIVLIVKTQVMKQRSEQYGPVYKEAIGPFCSVVISDLEEYAKVIAVDGRYPCRTEMEPYAHYLRKRGMVIGIVNRCASLTNNAKINIRCCFYRASYASAVLAVIVCLSVCLSV